MKPAFTVPNLRCDYLKNPCGIDDLQPNLSWELAADHPDGIVQKSYRISVASSLELLEKDAPDLWDSGEVISDQSVHVAYEGSPLTSRQRCFWKVRVTILSGLAQSSEAAFWTMGLLQPGDWKAQWVGLNAFPENPAPWFGAAEWIWSDEGRGAGKYATGSHWFVTGFEVPDAFAGLPVGIRAYGDDDCTIHLDGCEVARATPVMIYPDTNPLLCLYAAPRLQRIHPGLSAGMHRLALRAVNREGEDRPAGVILKLQIERDGKVLEVVTNGAWKHLPTETALPPEDIAQVSAKNAASLGAFGLPPWDQVIPREFRNLPARYLRKEIVIEPLCARATAYISGLGHFELYLNGRRVGDEVLVPNLTDYHQRVFYRTYDVTAHLRPGQNTLGVILGNGWYFAGRDRMPFEWQTYGCPKLLLQLEVENAEGDREIFATDATWKIFTDGPLGWNNLFDGEIYDARKEMPGWSEQGFDESGWKPVETVVNPLGILCAQMAEPQRVTETLQPIERQQKGPNRVLFDVGENIAGWSRVRLRGKPGTRVELRHAEKLDANGELSVDNLRSAACTDTIFLSDEPTDYEPRFVYHGFRHVEVVSDPEPLSYLELTGCVVNDDVRPAGSFTSSNAQLNQLFRAVSRGLRGNYHNVPTDCPQRDERLGWLGDRGAGCDGEMYFFDLAALYGKWVQDFADAQTPSGLVPDIAPPYLRAYNDDVTWPSCVTFVPRALYRHYGDKSMLRRYYPLMQRWVGHMMGYMQQDLISRDHWGDWCVPPESPELILTKDPKRKTDPTLLASAYFYRNLQNIAHFAKVTGQDADCEKYTAVAERLKAAFNRAFLDSKTSQYSNGSQTACLLPLALDLAPAEVQEAVFQSLLANLCTPDGSVLGVGLIGIQWLMCELSRRGKIDVAYDIATRTEYPSWGYMLKHGATTLWELWNGDTAQPFMNSGNHIMLAGDLHIWMFECLGGIRPDMENPGFKHILLEPCFPTQLDSVAVTHNTMHGTIRSAWKKSGSRIEWDVTIPPNTRATLVLPQVADSSLRIGGKPVGAPLKIGPGNFRIEGDLAPNT